jgi:hypothetical protein
MLSKSNSGTSSPKQAKLLEEFPYKRVEMEVLHKDKEYHIKQHSQLTKQDGEIRNRV